MKSHATLTLGFLLLGIHEPVSADVYRCTLTDGRTVYQEVPCSVGQQKAIDDRKAQAALREQQKRKDEELRIKEEKQRQNQKNIQEALERRRLQTIEAEKRRIAKEATKDDHVVDCYGLSKYAEGMGHNFIERAAIVGAARKRGDCKDY